MNRSKTINIFKIGIVLVVDSILIFVTTWLAFYLRLGDYSSIGKAFLYPAILATTLGLPIFIINGLYLEIFTSSGLRSIKKIAVAGSVFGVVFASIVLLIGVDQTPRTIGIIQPLLLFFAVSWSRIIARFWFRGLASSQRSGGQLSNVIIYGASDEGMQLATALEQQKNKRVKAFVDENTRFHGRRFNGYRVFPPTALPDIVLNDEINLVLLAIPDASRDKRNEILEFVSCQGVEVRTVPSLSDIAGGRYSISDVKSLDVEDLLGRDAVGADSNLLRAKVAGKTVVVTGAGGSIGSELCRQIINLSPERLCLLEMNEFSLYAIHSELEKLCKYSQLDGNTVLIPILGSAGNKVRMNQLFRKWSPDTVYHAAAYKHVPLVEHNLVEGITNNVLGTLYCATAAVENGVSDFVLVSTDKAVRPTNVMGASKRLAEMCLQALQRMAKYETGDDPTNSPMSLHRTKLSIVRFGNVLNSSGSVIPKFRSQIEHGGPITVTHENVVRYFMTIPEAAQLVIQASALADGGDVFVLDMGKPIKIVNLAKRMVELSGLTVRDHDNPDGDIEILITGLRPGEKLYEELQLGDDPQPTAHSKIMRAQDPFIPYDKLIEQIDSLNRAILNYDCKQILEILKTNVSGYQPSSVIKDFCE